MMNSSSLTTFGRKSRKLVKTEHFVKVLVGQDASLPGDEQVCLYPSPLHMVRFITLPFSEHTTIPGTLELLGAINTWLREILGANARLGPRPAPLSIEERNEDSARLVDSFSTKYIFLYLQGWCKLLTCHDTIGRSVPRGRRSLSWQTGKLLTYYWTY